MYRTYIHLCYTEARPFRPANVYGTYDNAYLQSYQFFKSPEVYLKRKKLNLSFLIFFPYHPLLVPSMGSV